jgi:DNA-directed RNA polymerase specialized sigma24 family protein
MTGNDFRDALAKTAIASRVDANRGTSETVRRAVAALPEELRLPLILAEHQGRSQAEIGEILAARKAVETRPPSAAAVARGVETARRPYDSHPTKPDLDR